MGATWQTNIQINARTQDFPAERCPGHHAASIGSPSCHCASWCRRNKCPPCTVPSTWKPNISVLGYLSMGTLTARWIKPDRLVSPTLLKVHQWAVEAYDPATGPLVHWSFVHWATFGQYLPLHTKQSIKIYHFRDALTGSSIAITTWCLSGSLDPYTHARFPCFQHINFTLIIPLLPKISQTLTGSTVMIMNVRHFICPCF